MLPRHIALAIAINLVWGFSFVAARVGVTEFSPFWFTGIRFILIALLLAPWLSALGDQLRPVLLIGLSVGLVHYGLMYFGIFHAGQVSAVAIAIQLTVPFSLLLAAVMLREEVGLLRWLGMGLAFVGVVILVFDPVVMEHLGGLLLVIAGALSGSLGLVLMRRLRGVGVLSLQGWVALISGPPLLLLSLGVESGQMAATLGAGWQGIGALFFTAIGASIIGQGGWYYLLQRYPVASVSPFGLLAPVFGVAFGVLIDGDQLSWKFVAGSALTLAGVAVVNLHRPPVKQELAAEHEHA